ncbi:helix-turn-helix transcriptional regulator [Candidatus Woesearchaeota archaeon]|nr:helix-turn-helix transcriptional regulator [Candidatus Woesearchaeota archaeon]
MPDEPFIMMSLKGDKAKKLANVLTNKSSSKILSYLANHEGATETQIAKELKLPISTVNYNMKALVEAKLVVDDEYHYSSRGKEVNHYRLARKYIIIAPEDEEEGFWERVKKYVPVALLAAGTGIVVRALSLFTGTYKMAGTSSLSDASFAQESIRSLPQAMPVATDTIAAEASEAGIMAMDAAPELFKAVAEDEVMGAANNIVATNVTNTSITNTTHIAAPYHGLDQVSAEAFTEPNLLQTIMGDWLGWFLIGIFVFVLAGMLVEVLRMKKNKKKTKKK